MRQILVACLVIAWFAGAAAASEPALDPKLGANLPREAMLTDSFGRAVRLGDLVDKPTVLVLDYMRCPSICGLVLSGLFDAIDKMPVNTADFRVVAISIDPRETPTDAASALADYRARFPRATQHAQFLVGAADDVRRIADATGFGFRFDERLDQYLHPAVLTTVTPQGKVSGYLDGVSLDAGTLALSLEAAADSRVGSTIATLRLLCAGNGAAGRIGDILLALARAAPFVLLGAGAMMFVARRRRLS